MSRYYIYLKVKFLYKIKIISSRLGKQHTRENLDMVRIQEGEWGLLTKSGLEKNRFSSWWVASFKGKTNFVK